MYIFCLLSNLAAESVDIMEVFIFFFIILFCSTEEMEFNLLLLVFNPLIMEKSPPDLISYSILLFAMVFF